MPFVTSTGLVDTATLWTATPNGFGGWTFSAPVTIKCRWEDRSIIYHGRIDHEEKVSRAVVFVDRDVGLNDWLFHGTSTALDPTVVDGAFPVQDFQRLTDLHNVEVVRKVLL